MDYVEMRTGNFVAVVAVVAVVSIVSIVSLLKKTFEGCIASCPNSHDCAILTFSKNAVCSTARYVDAPGSMMPPISRTLNLL